MASEKDEPTDERQVNDENEVDASSTKDAAMEVEEDKEIEGDKIAEKEIVNAEAVGDDEKNAAETTHEADQLPAEVEDAKVKSLSDEKAESHEDDNTDEEKLKSHGNDNEKAPDSNDHDNAPEEQEIKQELEEETLETKQPIMRKRRGRPPWKNRNNNAGVTKTIKKQSRYVPSGKRRGRPRRSDRPNLGEYESFKNDTQSSSTAETESARERRLKSRRSLELNDGSFSEMSVKDETGDKTATDLKDSEAKDEENQPQDSVSVNEDPKLASSTKNDSKKRGRPSSCNCPNCVSGADIVNMNKRHNCHIAGCTRAYPGVGLLKAHLLKSHIDPENPMYKRKSKEKRLSDVSDGSEDYVPNKPLKGIGEKKKLFKTRPKKYKKLLKGRSLRELTDKKFDNMLEFIGKMRGITNAFERLSTDIKISLLSLKNDEEFEELLQFSIQRFNALCKFHVDGARDAQQKISRQYSELKALNNPFGVIDRQRGLSTFLNGIEDPDADKYAPNIKKEGVDEEMDIDEHPMANMEVNYSSSDDDTPLIPPCEVTITELPEEVQEELTLEPASESTEPAKPQIRLVSLQNLLDPRLMATGLVAPMPEKYHIEKEIEFNKMHPIKRRTINIKTKIQSRQELAKCRSVKVLVARLPRNLNNIMRRNKLQTIRDEKGEVICEKVDGFEIQALEDETIEVEDEEPAAAMRTSEAPRILNRDAPMFPHMRIVHGNNNTNPRPPGSGGRHFDVEELLARQEHIIPRNRQISIAPAKHIQPPPLHYTVPLSNGLSATISTNMANITNGYVAKQPMIRNNPNVYILPKPPTVTMASVLPTPVYPAANKFDAHLLPPIEVNGVPTPLGLMSTLALHSLAIRVLKRLKLYNIQFSTPRPLWWPISVPFRNIDCDPRTPDEKARKPWRKCLQNLITSAYLYFGRSDLSWLLTGDDSPSTPYSNVVPNAFPVNSNLYNNVMDNSLNTATPQLIIHEPTQPNNIDYVNFDFVGPGSSNYDILASQLI